MPQALSPGLVSCGHRPRRGVKAVRRWGVQQYPRPRPLGTWSRTGRRSPQRLPAPRESLLTSFRGLHGVQRSRLGKTQALTLHPRPLLLCDWPNWDWSPRLLLAGFPCPRHSQACGAHRRSGGAPSGHPPGSGSAADCAGPALPDTGSEEQCPPHSAAAGGRTLEPAADPAGTHRTLQGGHNRKVGAWVCG